MVRVQSISKYYNDAGIFDIDFSIPQNKVLLITGRSGSGKTLLMKLMMGLVFPDKGNIYLFDKCINNMNRMELKNIRKRIGVLFQNNALFDSLNVYENIKMALNSSPDIDEYKIFEMLKIVDLQNKENMKIHELSGGMQKRVAIARAIIHNPELVFYDEPITGLDPITGENVIKLIKNLCIKYEKTSIIVTHDIRGFIEFADYILLLDKGNMIFWGNKEDYLRSKDSLIKAYLKVAGYYEKT